MSSTRYDHPRTFWFFVSTFLIGCFGFAFMAIPDSPFAEAIGVTGLQNRLSDFYQAGFWYARVQMDAKASAPLIRKTYGNIIGLDKDGTLVISESVNDRFERTRVRLADVRLKDSRGTAALLRRYRAMDATFEVYPDDQTVIWLREVPLNVKLIEAGLAEPDPNPPTNIVDQAFATYYWRNFYGTH